MLRRMKPRLLCTALLYLLGSATQARAQKVSAAENSAQPERAPMMRPQHATLSVNGGVSAWDLSGTGNSVILAVRLDRPLGVLWLLGEGSLATLRTDEQSGHHTYLIPEVQLQLQIPRAISPYLGAGAGAFSRIGGDGRRQSVLTTTGSVGLRLWGVIPRAVLRGEFRLRGIGREFTGSAFETTGGIGWTF